MGGERTFVELWDELRTEPAEDKQGCRKQSYRASDEKNSGIARRAEAAAVDMLEEANGEVVVLTDLRS